MLYYQIIHGLLDMNTGITGYIIRYVCYIMKVEYKIGHVTSSRGYTTKYVPTSEFECSSPLTPPAIQTMGRQAVLKTLRACMWSALRRRTRGQDSTTCAGLVHRARLPPPATDKHRPCIMCYVLSLTWKIVWSNS